MHPLARFILAIPLLAGLAPAFAAPLPCAPEGALPLVIERIGEDGVIPISDGLSLTLANIVWPDHLEPAARGDLVARLKSASAGQRLSWKPAAGPDRWGHVPAHLFVQEPGGALAPFWLQAGLVEAGLAPAWPEPDNSACWALLRTHEGHAIKARRGYWAPRAQTHRHRVIEASRPAHAGRKTVALWRVASVRPWRNLVFVNFAPSFRGAPSLGLTSRQVAQLAETGLAVQDWKGKRIVVRFILGGLGLSRIRIEAPRHLDLVE